MNIRPAVAAVAGLVAGVVLAGGVAVAHPTVIGDVRIGVYSLFDEADQRNTPTGRQFGDDFARMVRRQVNEAIVCEREFTSPDCQIEEAPDIP
jgi:hypothetical protein